MAMQIIALLFSLTFRHTRSSEERDSPCGPYPLGTSAAKEIEECLPSSVNRGSPPTCSDARARLYQPHNKNPHGGCGSGDS